MTGTNVDLPKIVRRPNHKQMTRFLQIVPHNSLLFTSWQN